MGASHREDTRAGSASIDRSWWRSKGLVFFVLSVVVLTFIVSELRSPVSSLDRWNALQRAISRESVGWCGIGFDGVLPAEQTALGVPCALRVTVVAPHGPADRAGLKRGDYIVGLNGSAFPDVLKFQGDASAFGPGDTITLNLVRDGLRQDVRITLTSWSEITKLDIAGIGL